MKFLLSRFFALLFFVLLGFTFSMLLATASAQEAQNASTNVVSSAPLTAEGPTASPSPESSSVVPSNDGGSNTPTLPSEIPSSSVVPTDPSMIPPPEATSANTESGAPLPTDPNASSSASTPSEEMESPVNTTESIEKKNHELKVRYTEVRTQVEKEPSVAALRLKADQAATEEGKRQALRAYYELLFKRMKQIDGSLSKRCDLMQSAYLRRLEQIGIEPTIPLHSPPTLDETGTTPSQEHSSARKEISRKKKSTSQPSPSEAVSPSDSTNTIL